MSEIADIIFEALLKVFKYKEIVVVLISILPIVEARLAIPIAIRYGMHPVTGWVLAFIGSSVIVPLLLLVLIPFVKWLAKTRLFKKVGSALYDKFEKKSESVEKNGSDLKKMLGVFTFVAVPLPLTGVWTGSAVASVVKLNLPKGCLAVIAGNLVAGGIITLLCAFLPQKAIDWVILALTVIAVAVLCVLIVKIALHKPKEAEKAEESKKE